MNKGDLGWKNIRLQAADGTKLTIDYSPLSLGSEIIAAPLWVTVAAPRFKGSEKVRALIMTYYETTNMPAKSRLFLFQGRLDKRRSHL